MALPPSLEVQFAELLRRLKEVARRLRIGHPRQVRLSADVDVYALGGINADLTKNTPSRTLTADVQSYAVTGVAATLNKTTVSGSPYRLTALGSSYAVSGKAASFVRGPFWQASIPDQSLTVGVSAPLDLDTLCDPDTVTYTILSGSVPGLTLSGSVYSGVPTTAGTYDVVFRADDGLGGGTAAQADWLSRINGAGVVWYNGFDSDAEVNAYRWSAQATPGGNDPNAATASASAMSRLPTSGPGGLPCLQILHSGASQAPDVNWWRPMSPMAAPGNGRTSNDPGAGKTIRTWAPTQGGNQTQQWNQDFWGPQTYPQEFYFQIRIKRDPRRVSASYNAAESVGKLLFLSLTSNSLTAQEIVTYSGSGGGSGGTTNDFHRMYVGGSPPMESLDPLGRSGQQVGGQLSSYPSNYCDVTQNPSKCWSFSGGWDTLLYHITPGTHTTGSGLSTIRVYAAREGVPTYTKIWDQQFTHSWQTSTTKGWNAVILNVYQNNTSFPGPFWQRYAQLIFSTQFIPCPQV